VERAESGNDCEAVEEAAAADQPGGDHTFSLMTQGGCDQAKGRRNEGKEVKNNAIVEITDLKCG
jgi:hypothetical protein